MDSRGCITHCIELVQVFSNSYFGLLVSWKNRNISGKIREFDSGIRLETLILSLDGDCNTILKIKVIMIYTDQHPSE